MHNKTIETPCLMKEQRGVKYFTFPHFDSFSNFKHCFTTRIGGVSPPPFDSLNPAINSGTSYPGIDYSSPDKDKLENVAKNRNNFHLATGLTLNDFVDLDHGDNIFVVNKDNVQELINREKALYKLLQNPTEMKIKDKIENLISQRVKADAIITDIPEIPLTIYYADCVPVFIMDPVRKVIALVHGGWRSTAKGISQKTAILMQKKYGSKPGDILAGIGSSIGPCCFEVKRDVAEIFKKSFMEYEKFIIKKKERIYIDLWQANIISLKQAGLNEKNIINSRLCTSCNQDLFFSYRKSNAITGRLAGFFMLSV